MGHAARRRAAPARAPRRRSGRGHDPQGLLALQRAVAGRAAGVRGRRLLRGAARGRALGGLPAVLHALPLSAPAPGLPGRALPPVAARGDRRHHPRAVREPAGRRRPAPAGGLHPRADARAPREPPRRPRRRGARRAPGGGLQARAHRGERARAPEARRQARVGAREHGVDRVRARQLVLPRGRRAQAGLRARGGRGRWLPAVLGPRVQRRDVLPHRPGGGRARRGRGRRPGARGARLPPPSRRGRGARFCPSP